MKKIFPLMMLLINTFLGLAQTMTPARMEARSLEILKKYDPEGYEIIIEYEKAPSKYKIGGTSITLSGSGSFMNYVNGKTEKDIISHLNTAVHESNHGYTSKMVYQLIQNDPNIEYQFKDNYYLYYINSQEKIMVKLTPTFPSKKLADVITNELRTFRFNTYIRGVSSTQQHGIYGLLDEMNSYYMGTKNSYLLYDYYTTELKAKGKDWLDYMSEVDGTLYAYLEFKFYILKYLLYAQKNEVKIYQGIMDNQDFKNAFLKTDQNFANLAKNYFAKRLIILDNLKNQGHRVELGDEFTYIDGSGTGNFMDVFNLLQNELNKKEYSEMMALLKK